MNVASFPPLMPVACVCSIPDAHLLKRPASTSKTRAPHRAAVMAAAVPAGPPPATIRSYRLTSTQSLPPGSNYPFHVITAELATSAPSLSPGRSARNARTAFRPPKANELEIAQSTAAACALFTTRFKLHKGSGSVN